MRLATHLGIVDPAQQGEQPFAFGNPSQRISGIYKAADLFLLTLFTPKGTDPLDRSAGTEYPGLVQMNADAGTVESLMHLYVDDATAQVKTHQRAAPYLSLSERLLSATITGFRVLGGGRYECSITLQVMSGERLTVLAPYIP